MLSFLEDAHERPKTKNLINDFMSFNLVLTKNKANDVIKPSLVSSHGPPYSSSSIF